MSTNFSKRQMVESSDLKNLFNGIFGEECYTLETKWVRVLGSKEATDVHSVRIEILGLLSI